METVEDSKQRFNAEISIAIALCFRLCCTTVIEFLFSLLPPIYCKRLTAAYFNKFTMRPTVILITLMIVTTTRKEARGLVLNASPSCRRLTVSFRRIVGPMMIHHDALHQRTRRCCSCTSFSSLFVSTTSAEAIQSGDYEEYLDEVLQAAQEEEVFTKADLPETFFSLPQHSHTGVNAILRKTESIIQNLHYHQQQEKSRNNDASTTTTTTFPPGGSSSSSSSSPTAAKKKSLVTAAKEAGRDHELIYANSYVDLGKIDVIGFDFDYTLVTYTEELLELIYEKALQRLVLDRQYPSEMLECGMKFDPFFSIRGLAVDKENGWITHLSYTHKVAVAWEGREKVPTSRIFEEYQGKRALRPSERRKRLKPLNDLFSMAECCLIADTIQFFKERSIPYCAQNVVTDVLKAVTDTHVSGDFHRIVANNPERYFDPTPHLKDVLVNLKASGKRLIFVSNSPFWYVDAGMRYVLGANWRDVWDAVVTSKYSCY